MYDYTNDQVEFKGWPKTTRIKGNLITITEKIDGTNACVIVRDGQVVGMQSRNRMIKPGDDNMGFAFWVHENRDELAQLGDGYHYGEWAGPGIQQNKHNFPSKQFFLFNTFRPADTLPSCVKQVPILFHGAYSNEAIEETMQQLWEHAGAARYIPEGIIIYFHTTKVRTKETFLHKSGKWAA
jgi:hypothetical protein